METRTGDGAHHIYGKGVSGFVMKEKDLMGVGKKSLEWDLNDWKWDGDLFVASPLNPVPSDCRGRDFFPVGEVGGGGGGFSNSSSSCSEEVIPESDKGKKELEKRRRVIVIEDDELCGEAENLTLKLGEHVFPIAEGGEAANWDGKNGKKAKLTGTVTNRAACQVQDCRADLSTAKDYHRRHKVCEMHSKSTQALVGNAMQRFCQQCSRFHLLQEFDEGKRSCRRRLDGHNKRRRKTHPDTAVNGSSLNDDQATNNSDQPKDQDILSHLLKNLASLGNASNGRNISGFQQASQEFLNAGTSAGASTKIAQALPSSGSEPSRFLGSTSTVVGCTDVQDPHRSRNQHPNVPTPEMRNSRAITNNAWGASIQTISPEPLQTIHPTPSTDRAAKAEVPEYTARRNQLNDIDLNDTYNEPQDCIEGLERSHQTPKLATNSPDCPLWLQQTQQSSPPQTSGNSDSGSAQSPSSSNGDAQGRTDRIVFKLFGKYPNDFPLVLRAQVLDWLSHSPTDIESYIRPGCIVLTIYLRQEESMWEELRSDLTSKLSRLLDISDDPFWKTGWVYARVQHQIAFIHDGQVVLDMSLPIKQHTDCMISSISPLAVSVSEGAQFCVKGFNLFRPTTRLFCALEGKYLVHEAICDLLEGPDTIKEDDEIQCLSFSCSVSHITGRGFIEVDDDGLSSSSFPFIVAEQDVSSEICMLESAIEAVESDDDDDDDDYDGGNERTAKQIRVKDQALNFIHEIGWLFHRSRLRSKLGHLNPNTDSFSFMRFKGLVEFSMDHDWCAVVKKLLDILFEGTVDAGEHTSIELALSEMGLLHKAVRRSCKLMVELLLRYIPPQYIGLVDRGSKNYLFRPDAVGPSGLTPLHIAASTFDSENVLDALTDDPESVGVIAWKSVYDNTGFTPEDYARLRGHYSYIHLVQRKINKKSEAGHVILDIPVTDPESNTKQKQDGGLAGSPRVTSLQVERTSRPIIRQSCKLCDQKLVYRNTSKFLGYRPAMLSMVAIAAVCVCLGLLFKSQPEVLCVFPPFRWESLEFGSM